MIILHRSFYCREDVVQIAREALGKFLVTSFNGQITSGLICETEAYAGISDRASHAFGGRRTGRTEIMFRTGGTAYVYLCYGIHSLFNLVTNNPEIPHAVLIRGIMPADGHGQMTKRNRNKILDRKSGIGPGKVTRLLGINFTHSGFDLTEGVEKSGIGIWLEDRGIMVPEENIIAGPRVGVDYAGDDALLPYRFTMR